MRLTAHADGRFVFGTETLRCALGPGGVVPADEKREGDGASPAGVWALKRVLYRADRVDRPETTLPLRAIRPDDGWCDSPDDPGYNRPVRLPYPASAEAMTRDDALYDIVVVLAHNDAPPIPGAGSAIFLHCAKPGYPPTRGCVALNRPDLERVLAACGARAVLEIAP